jgi:hypothetical protein
MYKSLIFLLFSIQFISFNSNAQNKFTISGYIKDEATGESLIGAGILAPNNNIGVYTNEYGFYSLQVNASSIKIKVSYIGYQALDTVLIINDNIRLNVNLNKNSSQIKEIVIKSQKDDNNVQSTEMGKVDLSIEKIKSLPAIFGEVDILKTIQLLPGIQSGGEGSTGFYVRGGGPDQNLIQLDEATVYNSSHLFGFFSVFNSDAINSATIYKGGIPANYGGRVSSVLDISMKEGNSKSYHASGGIGLIASRLTVEGPIEKNKSSFILSGRRTYIDVLAKPFITNEAVKGTGYYFYDFNAKANYTFNDKNRIFLSGYFGKDIFDFKNADLNISIPWGNATTTLRWNHLFNTKLFMNTSAIYNSYNFRITADQENIAVTLYSGIRDLNFKCDFNYYANARNEIKFGANYIYHVFTPSTFSGESGDTKFEPQGITKKNAHEAAIYILDKYTLSESIEINAGLRYAVFTQVGPYTKYNRDFTGQITDSITWDKNEFVKLYQALEPRILMRISLNKVSSIKASFNINNQFVHLVSSNGTTLPTDIWVPSTKYVKPQIGYQYSAGYFRNFKKNTFETSVEIYYKKLFNQIEYKEGYTPSVNEDLEESFVFGEGDSKGIELYINKKEGKFTGWVGYTLSYTNRKFADLNEGEKFPYRYDRRHVLSVALTYQINDKWTAGAVFVYNTGIAYTLPVGKYFIEGNVITQYADLNSVRLKAYHRLDLSATYDNNKKKRKIDDSWTFSLYNTYSRLNPYFIYNDISGIFLQDATIQIQAKQVSLFPILPSVTWNFKF